MSEASCSGVRSIDEMAQPRFALYEKVIIVDEREIFHNIDQCRRIVWPFKALRHKGGRLSWDGWEPRAGMVGYVIHIWRPNHPNKMCRTPLHPDVYLIEIGENYVPVTANGLRQYNQAMDSAQKEIETSRRNSLQREMAEFRQQQADRGLTPILGSSLESPTSLMNEAVAVAGQRTGGTGKCGIQAVSSSSSEDESCLMNLEKERQEEYLKNLWKQVVEQEKKEKEREREIQIDKEYNREDEMAGDEVLIMAEAEVSEEAKLAEEMEKPNDITASKEDHINDVLMLECKEDSVIEIGEDSYGPEEEEEDERENSVAEEVILNKLSTSSLSKASVSNDSKDFENISVSTLSMAESSCDVKDLVDQLVDQVVDVLCDSVVTEEEKEDKEFVTEMETKNEMEERVGVLSDVDVVVIADGGDGIGDDNDGDDAAEIKNDDDDVELKVVETKSLESTDV